VVIAFTVLCNGCRPLHALQSDIIAIYDEANQNGDCSNSSYEVMQQYMSTIVFPCNDVATHYYPCTIEKMNADAMDCYAKNGVIVRNALIPTPGSLSNADEMCSYVFGISRFVFVCIRYISFCARMYSGYLVICSYVFGIYRSVLVCIRYISLCARMYSVSYLFISFCVRMYSVYIFLCSYVFGISRYAHLRIRYISFCARMYSVCFVMYSYVLGKPRFVLICILYMHVSFCCRSSKYFEFGISIFFSFRHPYELLGNSIFITYTCISLFITCQYNVL